jgi:UDP-N-acetylglucosamine 1-carboxyvinyltransferase
MDKLVIQGGHRLRGELPVSGSKNTALPLMSAAVLAGGATTLTNIPNLRDVTTFAHVLRITGAAVRFDPANHRMEIDASRIDFPEAPYDLVKKMRASFYMLGALLGRCGSARVSLPGGCAWGPRPVDLHMEGMKALGAEIDLDQGYVVARAPGGRLQGGQFHLEPSSVGATINLLLAAVTARGSSRITNAAREPDVVVFGEALKAMGAQIDGLGTTEIEVQGVDALHPTEFRNAPDRIELGTFMILAAIAGAHDDIVHLSGAEPAHLGDAFVDAFARTGTPFRMGPDYVDIIAPEKLRAVSIETGVYPGFPTDLQAQWTVLLTRAHGNGRIVDHIYFDRFAHIGELHRMGVNAIVVGNEVVVQGGKAITGAHVMSTDLRGSVSLVMAGMVAQGETHVQRIYHLDRGYESLEGKLRAVGASVRREEYEEFSESEVEATMA